MVFDTIDDELVYAEKLTNPDEIPDIFNPNTSGAKCSDVEQRVMSDHSFMTDETLAYSEDQWSKMCRNFGMTSLMPV